MTIDKNIPTFGYPFMEELGQEAVSVPWNMYRSDLEQKEELYRRLEETYQAGLQMSGRTIYRYLVKGRCAILPPETAQALGVPEVIQDLPAWNVNAGRILPESVKDWNALFDAIDRGEASGSTEVLFRRNNGEVRRSLVEFLGRRDNQGRPESAIISYRDITEEYAKNRLRDLEMEGLLMAARRAFPEILLLNLTQGTYRIVQYYQGTRLNTPQEGRILDMLNLRLSTVAPEDQQAFRENFYPENLIKTMESGVESICLTYRRRGQGDSWHWLETTAMRMANAYDDDLLAVATSRNVDQQKEDEETLRLALASASEQLSDWQYYHRLTSDIFPGMVYISYMDERPAPYTEGQLGQILDCDIQELALGRGDRVHPEDTGKLDATRDTAEAAGGQSYDVEYRFRNPQGEYVHISNQAVAFTDREGDRGYAHFLVDTTREHEMADKLRLYMEERLKENEQIFRIVAQHSNRMLCHYDLGTRMARPWDEANCAGCPIPNFCAAPITPQWVDATDAILPESKEDMKGFLKTMGNPYGEANIHIRLEDGRRRWFHFKSSTLFQEGRPMSALISFEDITDEHEQELSHLRVAHALDPGDGANLGYLEADLTTDLVEKQEGYAQWGLISSVGKSYSLYWANHYVGTLGDENQGADELYRRDTLMELYRQGERTLEHIWRVERSGSNLWAKVKGELIADPFTGHIKCYISATDVTEEEEARRAMSQRADHDTMTGLLRRGSGEAKIREYLAQNHEKSGILVVLDMDDLKGVNDTLGHEQGDRAIRSIADTLASHFRKDDLVIRLGGDEFMAFLPGAGQSRDAVSRSMAALLRKLSALPVGENDERTIHCSAGCAVALPGTDTFESLYRRADLALYHVKRNGKNSFAFFEGEMLQEDYQFKNQTMAVQEEDEEEITRFILALVKQYAGSLVSMNLTRNQYRVLSVGRLPGHLPKTDTIDILWRVMGDYIYPDDWQAALLALSRKRLLEAYEGGKTTLKHTLRYRAGEGWIWADVQLQFHVTDSGDLCAMVFLQGDKEVV